MSSSFRSDITQLCIISPLSCLAWPALSRQLSTCFSLEPFYRLKYLADKSMACEKASVSIWALHHASSLQCAPYNERPLRRTLRVRPTVLGGSTVAMQP